MDREEETVRGEDMMVCCQEEEAGVCLIWEGRRTDIRHVAATPSSLLKRVLYLSLSPAHLSTVQRMPSNPLVLSLKPESRSDYDYIKYLSCDNHNTTTLHAYLSGIRST